MNVLWNKAGSSKQSLKAKREKKKESSGPTQMKSCENSCTSFLSYYYKMCNLWRKCEFLHFCLLDISAASKLIHWKGSQEVTTIKSSLTLSSFSLRKAKIGINYKAIVWKLKQVCPLRIFSSFYFLAIWSFPVLQEESIHGCINLIYSCTLSQECSPLC